MSDRPSVLLLHAGGTLGMLPGSDGRFAPVPGALARALADLPELRHPDLPEVELVEFEPLLDSSDMQPADWQRIADTIQQRASSHAGTVVIHGTDTMAYAASVLSFLLHDLNAPVIFTGAQIPLVRPRSDARENLITALLLACDPQLAEVAIYASGALLRGNRATKVSASGFDAFASPNLPPLAQVGVDVRWNRELLRAKAAGPVRADRLGDAKVVALRLFPGIDAPVLQQILARPVQGLVLETYGAGNGPSRDRALVRVLAEASERGVAITAVSQCLRGGVDMNVYAAAGPLLDAGVVPGGDMTAEAALAKLLWLLSSDPDPAEVRSALQRDLRGERSEGSGA